MSRFDLAGRWELIQGDDSTGIPANVPGDNLSALYKAKKVTNPYDGKNELDLQWIGRVGWTYVRTFKVSATMLAETSIQLSAENLDTFATIRINGRIAGRTENAFRQYQFEVKSLLKKGENEIRIAFAPHEQTVDKLARKLPYKIPHMNSPVQSMHRNLARKCQCHSGWDWGPCLMVSGIYGELALHATSQGRIASVVTAQSFKGKDCAVTVGNHRRSRHCRQIRIVDHTWQRDFQQGSDPQKGNEHVLRKTDSAQCEALVAQRLRRAGLVRPRRAHLWRRRGQAPRPS